MNTRIVTLLAGICCLFALMAGSAMAAVSIGQTAPSFHLTTAGGNEQVSLDSLLHGKKAAVLMFISVDCPYSNAYNDRMEALASKYGARGVAFAGINSDCTETAEQAAEHAKEHNFTFPVLKDNNNVVADAYGASHTPEVYVVDAQGNLVYHGRIDNSTDPGGVTSHDLANGLDQILAGQKVADAETKAFGCSIKRVNQQ